MWRSLDTKNAEVRVQFEAHEFGGIMPGSEFGPIRRGFG